MLTGRGELRIVAASWSPAPITWSATCWVSPLPAGEVFLSGVKRGSPMPAMVSPATVVVVLFSTIAFGCRATAAAVLPESWLPRMKTYGFFSRPIEATKEASGSLPQSVMSPVSITTSMPNCSTTVRMSCQPVGLRCMSETCSTRVVPGVGSNSGSAETVV